MGMPLISEKGYERRKRLKWVKLLWGRGLGERSSKSFLCFSRAVDITRKDVICLCSRV